ncbi:hypothetical protein WJR50_00910 [Catalinimonas sp. 4WD22]|uniref:hypothetical protein n=1 Tax=Catalinimonas locisalis TaxID=3133978 RepID=UPI0031014865
MHQPFAKKGDEHLLPARLSSIFLAGIILIFSTFAIQQTAAQLKVKHSQQEVLEFVPAVSSSDALIIDSCIKLSFSVYLFIYCTYRPAYQAYALTYALKESLSVPSFLRNPFYVFTSIHAP